MFFSRFALFLVLVQCGCIGYGYFALMTEGTEWSKTLYHFFIYGSPVYLVMNFLNESSVLRDTNIYIISLTIFHLVKYLSFFKARLNDEACVSFYIAVGLEILYLGYSAYLLY